MNKIIEERILEVMQGCNKMLKDKTVEESTEIIMEVKVIAEVEIGTGLEKDHFLETLVMVETIGVQAIVGPDQDQGQIQIDRIRCYKCTEYDHFTKDCPTFREERELE